MVDPMGGLDEDESGFGGQDCVACIHLRVATNGIWSDGEWWIPWVAGMTQIILPDGWFKRRRMGAYASKCVCLGQARQEEEEGTRPQPQGRVR